ncbi:MAG: hypothetical protein SF187_23985 [Deltaproteobacteria bacterium]|nr:hypothetical protein [Deltaproteobacteria bacterium]
MATWDQFTKWVAGGSHSQAYTWLLAQEPKAAFDACFASTLNQRAAFDTFWDNVPLGEKLNDLILDFVYQGYMPQRPYSGVSMYDYDLVRELYLRSLERTKLPGKWPSRHKNSTSVCLYPEYARRGQTLRSTIVSLASDHLGGGPSKAWQGNLFCLGGRYTFGIGMQGANPRPPGTTCMLFVRSILHAAGINVIGPKTPSSCSCDEGLAAEIAHLKCYVSTKLDASPPVLKPGDIFHIQGKDFKNNVGSAHVGIVTSIAGNKWTCIQGGARDHVTKQATYTLKRASDSKWGTWFFEEDVDSVNMIRGIWGYWNVDLIGSGNMMRGG